MRHDVANVRSQFDQYWHGAVLDGPASNALIDGRLLTYRATHAALAHSVWATEVQFQSVRARINGFLDDFPPFRLGFHHEGDNDRVLWEQLLGLSNFP